jgi:predicted kinase
MNTNCFQLPTLHLVCGKIAAGKSTLTHQIAARPKTVLISEDVWLSQLYADEIHTIADYVRRSGQLRNILAAHVESLLLGGLSVVLDFPANTLGNRRWMKDIIDSAGVAHELHYLDSPDELCKMRLRKRNAEGSHPYTPTDAEFDEITRYFVPPSSTEGFNIVRYEQYLVE